MFLQNAKSAVLMLLAVGVVVAGAGVLTYQALKAGEDWMTVKNAGMGEEIAGQKVGIIGAGHVGRAAISLLVRVGANVCVYDPFLGEDCYPFEEAKQSLLPRLTPRGAATSACSGW